MGHEEGGGSSLLGRHSKGGTALCVLGDDATAVSAAFWEDGDRHDHHQEFKVWSIVDGTSIRTIRRAPATSREFLGARWMFPLAAPPFDGIQLGTEYAVGLASWNLTEAEPLPLWRGEAQRVNDWLNGPQARAMTVSSQSQFMIDRRVPEVVPGGEQARASQPVGALAAMINPLARWFQLQPPCWRLVRDQPELLDRR